MKQNGKARAAPGKVPNAEHPYPLFKANRQFGSDDRIDRDNGATGSACELGSTNCGYGAPLLP